MGKIKYTNIITIPTDKFLDETIIMPLLKKYAVIKYSLIKNHFLIIKSKYLKKTLTYLILTSFKVRNGTANSP